MQTTSKRAALHNLGCKVNSYETEAMQQLLEDAGYSIVPFNEPADVYVINTCSVTNIADKKSRQMLHRARKMNPDAIVVAAGCYVQAKEETIIADGIADIVVGNNKKHELVPLIERYLADKGNDGEVIDINESGVGYENLVVTRTAEHTRAFIKVQDGCNQFCSYCIIPYVRGRVRSRELDDVTDEVRHLAASGYREVVLTGIHLSSYGTDTGGSLIHLIAEIARIDGIERIRLGSLEPRIVTEEFAAHLSQCGKVCPHFHLSLQSGCDAVLSRMNRKYDTALYEKCCDTLRRYFVNPAITTDVIVGFPGETDEEFEATVAFLERIGFYEMHIFKYSRREGTRAAAMADQVDEQVKNIRSARLLALDREMSEKYREAQIGCTVTALMEEPYIYEGRKYFTGYTPEYVKVAYETGDEVQNTFVTGEIAGRLCGDIMILHNTLHKM